MHRFGGDKSATPISRLSQALGYNRCATSIFHHGYNGLERLYYIRERSAAVSE